VYNLQFVTVCCLAQLFGNGVYTVTVRQNSTLPEWQDNLCRKTTLKKNEGSKCQHTDATTRRQSVYVRDGGFEFEQNSHTLIHEFYHVIQQWDNGRMNRRSYLLNVDMWEAEAIAAESQVQKFEKCRQDNCQCPLYAQ
jgi:hypothetical protein